MKYEVLVYRNVRETQTIVVDADNEDDACEAAQQEACEGPDNLWEYANTTDIDVLDCTEIKE